MFEVTGVISRWDADSGTGEFSESNMKHPLRVEGATFGPEGYVPRLDDVVTCRIVFDENNELRVAHVEYSNLRIVSAPTQTPVAKPAGSLWGLFGSGGLLLLKMALILVAVVVLLVLLAIPLGRLLAWLFPST